MEAQRTRFLQTSFSLKFQNSHRLIATHDRPKSRSPPGQSAPKLASLFSHSLKKKNPLPSYHKSIASTRIFASQESRHSRAASTPGPGLRNKKRDKPEGKKEGGEQHANERSGRSRAHARVINFVCAMRKKRPKMHSHEVDRKPVYRRI